MTKLLFSQEQARQLELPLGLMWWIKLSLMRLEAARAIWKWSLHACSTQQPRTLWRGDVRRLQITRLRRSSCPCFALVIRRFPPCPPQQRSRRMLPLDFKIQPERRRIFERENIPPLAHRQLHRPLQPVRIPHFRGGHLHPPPTNPRPPPMPTPRVAHCQRQVTGILHSDQRGHRHRRASASDRDPLCHCNPHPCATVAARPGAREHPYDALTHFAAQKLLQRPEHPRIVIPLALENPFSQHPPRRFIRKCRRTSARRGFQNQANIIGHACHSRSTPPHRQSGFHPNFRIFPLARCPSSSFPAVP